MGTYAHGVKFKRSVLVGATPIALIAVAACSVDGASERMDVVGPPSASSSVGTSTKSGAGPSQAALNQALAVVSTACPMLTPQQRSLLAQGLSSLWQVNANDAQRQDAQLQQSNISLYVGNVEQVCAHTFTQAERRQITASVKSFLAS